MLSSGWSEHKMGQLDIEYPCSTLSGLRRFWQPRHWIIRSYRESLN